MGLTIEVHLDGTQHSLNAKESTDLMREIRRQIEAVGISVPGWTFSVDDVVIRWDLPVAKETD